MSTIEERDLRNWLTRPDASGEGGFPRLHSSRFLSDRRNETMLRDGVRVFESAMRYIEDEDLRLVLVLCCELRSGRKALGDPPRSLEKAERRAMTPPLIYRFDREQEPTFWRWEFRPIQTVPIDPKSLGVTHPDGCLTSWFMEAREEEYVEAGLDVRRSIYLRFDNAAPPTV